MEILEAGRGTRERPLILAGLPGSCMPPDSARHVSLTGQNMTSVSVLLVEDNEDNRTIYTTILRHCGHEVAEAGTGEEGIRLARELRPAVILMDVAMPGIDGWEATRRLKADPETAHIPVIALTAHAMAEDRQRAVRGRVRELPGQAHRAAPRGGRGGKAPCPRRRRPGRGGVGATTRLPESNSPPADLPDRGRAAFCAHRRRPLRSLMLAPPPKLPRNCRGRLGWGRIRARRLASICVRGRPPPRPSPANCAGEGERQRFPGRK